MSFLKITDPKKRDLIVAEYLKTKRNIQNAQLEERLGAQDTLATLVKQFKPVTDSQAALTQGIISELGPIKEGIRDLPKALALPQFPSITGVWPADDDTGPTEEEQDKPEYIGDIAAKYLRKFATKDADKVYGIYDKDGQFYIGDTRIGVIGDNIVVGGREYEGTPGLWELIVNKIPSDEVYTAEDYENYGKILVGTNALRKGNSKDSTTPKASRGWKWKYLLSTIWKERGRFEGEGLAAQQAALTAQQAALTGTESSSPIVIPSDPNALLGRL
jgi:hypothetical protein